MTNQVLSAKSDQTLRQIAKVLLENHIGGVPVVNDVGAVIGMVAECDLIAEDTLSLQPGRRTIQLIQGGKGHKALPGAMNSERVSFEVK